MGRFAGMGGCKTGMWLGTGKGCSPPATIGEGMQSCRAWPAAFPAVEKQIMGLKIDWHKFGDKAIKCNKTVQS